MVQHRTSYWRARITETEIDSAKVTRNEDLGTSKSKARQLRAKHRMAGLTEQTTTNCMVSELLMDERCNYLRTSHILTLSTELRISYV